MFIFTDSQHRIEQPIRRELKFFLTSLYIHWCFESSSTRYVHCYDPLLYLFVIFSENNNLFYYRVQRASENFTFTAPSQEMQIVKWQQWENFIHMGDLSDHTPHFCHLPACSSRKEPAKVKFSDAILCKWFSSKV